MIKKLTLLLLVCLSVNYLQAQTLGELKAKKSEIEAAAAAKQAEIDAFQGEIDKIKGEIEILSGWQTGLSGLVGLNFGNSSNWATNANTNSSSSNLNLGVNAFANNIKEKTFWRNSLVANVGWQGLDNNTEDTEINVTAENFEELGRTRDEIGDKIDPTGTSFLGDRNTDVLVGSSLWGYRLNQDFALSALGDFNSSVFNFLNPGSLDVGVGVTWTPHQIPNLVVVVHPLTYHIGWTAGESKQSLGLAGAKVKATYTREFPGGIVWSSNLGAFFPYSDEELTIDLPAEVNAAGETIVPTRMAGAFEYTWINSLAIADVWKGVGVGITYGLRKSEIEYDGLQRYSAVGLTYGF